MTDMYYHAQTMISKIIEENLPNEAVTRALSSHDMGEKTYLVAIGKAAWTMANAASRFLGDAIQKGVVITKYGHSQGKIPNMDIYEAGHPILDDNTVKASEAALALADDLTAKDTLLFLVSGGGSALFESPKDGISLEEIGEITRALLSKGANITEINMIRKRFSKVKAGGFAQICKPAKIFSVVLSDVLGDRLDTIASGPAVPDMSTCDEALHIAKKYGLSLTPIQKMHLNQETPKVIDNVKTIITGSVRSLCQSAADCAMTLGYTPYSLTTSLDCQAAEAGKFLAALARDIQEGHSHYKKPCAIIVGGETVVHVTGSGKGGRNQELALAAAKGISGLENTTIFSLGSDGTDGPTDAAGGIVDGNTASDLSNNNIDIEDVIKNNDSYNALKTVNGLIITGPTGTNVNDVAVVLCR